MCSSAQAGLSFVHFSASEQRRVVVYRDAPILTQRLGQGSGDENAFPEYAHRVFTTLPSGYRISKELPAKSTVTWVPSENTVRCRFLSPVRKA